MYVLSETGVADGIKILDPKLVLHLDTSRFHTDLTKFSSLGLHD